MIVTLLTTVTGEKPRPCTVYMTSGFFAHETLLARLGKHSIGKSCLYLKSLAEVDRPSLEALVRRSVADMRKRHPNRAAQKKR